MLGIVVGAGVAALAFVRGDQMALAALGAEPLAPGRFPQLDNIVEGLVVSNGFRMPISTSSTTPRPTHSSSVAPPVTAHWPSPPGWSSRLRRIELEGVLAHELSRIRSGETRAGVTAATLICRPLGFAGGLAESLAERLVDPAAGVRADLAGVSLTRYPPGLAAALVVLDADGRTVARNPRAYRHLWIDPPADAMVGAQFSMSDRVEVLTEL